MGQLDGGVDGRVFPLFFGRSWRFGGVRPFPHAAGVGTSGWWGEWKGFSFVSRAFVAFRGRSAVPAVPGVGGGSALKMLGFSDFQECWIFKCWSFRFSDVGILGFSDVGLFGFSGMLDFQMFECFCFGLDDFAKIGKLKILRRLRRALINLLAYLQKLQ